VSLDDFKIELNYNITDESLDILKQHINKSYYMLESAKIFLDIGRLPDFYSRLYYSDYRFDEFNKEESINNYDKCLNFVNTLKNKIDSGLKEIR